MVEPSDGREESVLIEAQNLVYGPREKDYDHPGRDFARTVSLLNILFADKLSEPLTPEDFGLIMICCKLAREVHRPKRDNLVDIAGYAETRSRILEGR